MTNAERKISRHAVTYAVNRVGGQQALGKLIGVSQPSIHCWISGEFIISGEYAIPVEKATDGKVTRHQLRPDLYPEEK